ncbi:MAG: L-2-amino-thiazoline-4-carboxylic acid hydrolase [Myxococcales bacterium]|nr:L-2-amino-thiazoline-4-carboxylic acid hydrolase [Myxococcales bacterium]
MEDHFFRRGLGSLFRQALSGLAEQRSILVDPEDIVTSALAVVQRHAHEQPPSTSPEVLAYTALLIAMYRALAAAARSPHEALEWVRETQNATTDFLRRNVRAALDAADDALALMRDASKEKEETWFGAAFRFERVVDDANAYHLEVLACEFVRLAAAEGVPELGPLFCEWDVAWIDAIDPKRHRLAFVRPTTIAGGCDRCRFYFDRVIDS